MASNFWFVHNIYGSFTLVKFVSKTINDINMRQSSKSQVTVTTVLALATLGSVTTNKNGPISVELPKVAKASTSLLLWHVTVARIISLTFANVNTALRYGKNHAKLVGLRTTKYIFLFFKTHELNVDTAIV